MDKVREALARLAQMVPEGGVGVGGRLLGAGAIGTSRRPPRH